MKTKKNGASTLENYDKKEFRIYKSTLLRYFGEGGDVVIPKGVKEIGDHAFSGRVDLRSVTFSNQVTFIGERAFSGCIGLRSVTLPKSLKEIGDLAFRGCIGLTSVFIPARVSFIGQNPFAACEWLESIVVSKMNRKYKSIGNCIIDKKTKTLIAGYNLNFVPKYVTSIAGHAFEGACFTKVFIPDSITSIGEFAFYLCAEMTAITIPSSVTYIGEGAFNGCKQLTSIVIPQSVTEIGFKEEINDPYYKDVEPKEHRIIFADCPALKTVKLPERFREQDLGIPSSAQVVYY